MWYYVTIGEVPKDYWVDLQMEIKLLEVKRQDIQKQRHYIANKGASSQGYGFSIGHVWMRVGLWRKLSAKELMLLNFGAGEDSWESLGMQGDPTSPS